MKKAIAVVLMMLLLTGCSAQEENLERIMGLRADLLGGTESSFDAVITADYGDEVHSFSMNCRGSSQGDLSFTVTAPESIAGVTGKFEGQRGMLTFDGFALEFPRLTDDQITPVSGPWILLRTLLGGYLTACGEEDDLLHVTIHDSYQEDSLPLDVWLNGEDAPVRGEILHNGRRIVTMDIENFTIS